ncbi:efflux transporter outer membrane subunit [Flavobacterium nitrogenifigens]|uniref:Efflux transporter, outer membrane factor (OMF) lipoprotein, NodT family n=1 Tax=Flavobacterium nitrogenifigens TaxID=1617283 RepID=A0A521BFK3_9FLAO|nr:efflux transporter outer membrane subunit [Flavobacterium nitrogenifigens]KAF2337461.1 efflux transporter outer membrane subunit [Flavobacterium nitrogenifigens]SMO45849.1 efflux transporter, outer membrane factor (OMF) lipoprotein, NodT family [Flavobacterium nitrogenifigens]
MKTLYKIGMVLLTGAIMTSCVVGKKYSRTELNAPEKFREEVAVTGDTVLLPWKNYYKDPLLVALIEKALVKNNEVIIAMKSMEQLDLSYKQAKLSLLPTLDFDAGASRSYQSKNSLNGSLSAQFIGKDYMDDYSANLRLSWEVDIWGKAAMQKRDAKAAYFAQKENLSALKTRIIVQVAQSYYNLLGLDEQLKIAEKNIDLSTNTLNMIQLQYKSGSISSLAVNQTEAQKKTAELLVPLAKANIAVQENALQILCGEYPDKIERAGNIDAAEVSVLFPAGIPASLLSRRPDVKASEYAVMSANAKTGLAKATMYPTLSLNPSIGVNSFEFENWFNFPGSVTKTIAANLAQPIFRKKALRTAYEVAVIEQEKAVVQFKQSFITAVGEVNDAMSRLKYADERMILAKDKAGSLDKATSDASLLYKSGMANYLEVIAAQNSSLQNELDLVTIKLEKLNAAINLYRALGGGVE